MSADRPGGDGSVSGTEVMLRFAGRHVVPSKSSRDTIRRYMSFSVGDVVRSVITTWSWSWFRLSRSDTSGLTAEIVPPPPLPEPTPLPAPSSRPPCIAGSGNSGTTRAIPSATAPIRRPVRTGANGAGAAPGIRGAPPNTRPHWDSRSRPSASSSIR
ncbi:hypothetical protein GCM10020256_57730 [Streptomyces thermocoprophilus]